jgi:hypothetical protein
VLRLAEPFPIGKLLLVAAICGPYVGAPFFESGGSVDFACIAGAIGFLVASALLLARRYAWIVTIPNEERLRVVRQRAFDYAASTLELSASVRVECAPVGNTMWIFVVATDGRAARVIPAASSRMIERVQNAIEAALKSSDTRPGTPSPRRAPS